MIDVEVGVERQVDFKIETVFEGGFEGVVEIGDDARVGGVFNELTEAGEGLGLAKRGWSDLLFEDRDEAIAPSGEKDGQVGLPSGLRGAYSGQEVGAFGKGLQEVF